MPLSEARLSEIVMQLAQRPGHPVVVADVRQILIEGLGVPAADVRLESPVPEVRGRIDGLLGRTVFEAKSNLNRERADAEAQLTRYLQQRETATGERYIGIATDGAQFRAYELHAGRLEHVGEYVTDVNAPQQLVDWLGGAVAVTIGLRPEPDVVRRELGRGSLAYALARNRLEAAWRAVRDEPDVLLKRDLWAKLLSRVYGTRIDADDLFFQHTYLTIVAKTMATSILGVALPPAAELLSGQPFIRAGIAGAVESDFFDWILDAPGCDVMIGRIGAQVGRFVLRDVQHDVLKSLYESLIDPETRHDLGEYYTPDWLAVRICERTVDDPLEQRVLDPACGSGTFLFHGVRRLLAAADEARITPVEAVQRCVDRVIGIDVHPVAAIIARVTYLMALGGDRLSQPGRPSIHVPVYLGDSLQWNVSTMMAEREVLIEAVGGRTLHFPYSVTRDASAFDQVLDTMLSLAEAGTPPEDFAAWALARGTVDRGDTEILVATYADLLFLYREGLDRIWGYVIRNLSRPLWLSGEGQRADVLVGNPPWLAYRFMDRETQEAFRRESMQRGIWAGGRFATHQDLSGYFFARCVELYLKGGGRIGFVMPYAALSRGQFAGLRSGRFGVGNGNGNGKAAASGAYATARFEEAWAFDDAVQPLFPVPACVLIARRDEPGVLPAMVTAYHGNLPRRDADTEAAARSLTSRNEPWPAPAVAQPVGLAGGYAAQFRQGATLVPRMLCVVERIVQPRLGASSEAPAVRSLRSAQEKSPWRSLAPVEAQVEREFVRQVYLGESIAPFRLLRPVEAVIPWNEAVGLMDAVAASGRGYYRLAGWLRAVEGLWERHGSGRLTFAQQLDYYGKLSAQLPPSPLRVVYAASGTLPAAAILADSAAVCEHKLYWAMVGSMSEARYLVAVLNSETLRARIAQFQSRGQFGARDFDKYLFRATIASFNPRNRLHTQLAQAAERAEVVAAALGIAEGERFVRTRGRVRQALQADGVAAEMDRLVERLLS